MIYGERVKQVREMRHLTQSVLADMVPGLTQYHLSRVERGAAEPNAETAALLAANLGVRVEFFEKPPTMSFEAQSPQLRARSSKLTQGVKSSALQWARLVEEVHEQLLLGAQAIPVRLERMVDAEPHEAAQEVRSALGFTQQDPLPYLVLAVERLGVIVLGLPYSAESLDAFCAWRGGRPVIAVLSDTPGDRLRFSVAHELGHLVLHDHRAGGRQLEAEADEFAAELLMPYTAIRKSLSTKLTLSSLTMLKSQWGVSIKSLIRRARELGYIDQDRATSLYKQVSARGWNRAEPGHVPIEKPRAFRKLAEIRYGPGPNIEALARDAGWSQELALDVIDKYATSEELPIERRSAQRDASKVHSGNVLAFRRRTSTTRRPSTRNRKTI